MTEIAALRQQFELLRARSAQAQEEIARLREERQRGVVVVQQAHKLETFKSSPPSSTRIEDWIEDCKHYVRKQKCVNHEAEAKEVIKHLDKKAKDELRWRDPAAKDTAEKIYAILRKTFGNLRTLAAMKSEFYGRKQESGETTEDFANALVLLTAEMTSKVDVNPAVTEMYNFETSSASMSLIHTCVGSSRRSSNRKVSIVYSPKYGK